MSFYDPKPPSREELGQRILRQSLIPQKILDWQELNQSPDPEVEQLAQEAQVLLGDLSLLAKAWQMGEAGDEQLAKQLMGFEHRRCKLNDCWLDFNQD